MIHSILAPDVVYKRSDTMDDMDRGKKTNVYTMSLGRKSIDIALGGVRNNYISQGIAYYPIYKIGRSDTQSNIGVFEIMANDEMSIGMASGEIDLGRMPEPLLYDEKDAFNNEVQLGEEEDEPDPEEHYVPHINSTWIASFMASNDYAIQNNEGGGDCLFAVIRDGLEKMGRVLSVEEMRDKISKEVTQETFENYLAISRGIKATKGQLELELENLSKVHKSLEARALRDHDLETKKKLVVEARRTEAAHDRVLQERKLNDELSTEYAFMSGVETLEDFRGAVRHCDFWADTWAITTLERILNIKLIILSEDAYNQGDLDNVLLCGQINDSQILKNKEFQPDSYIMTSYGQSHYKLITNRKRGAFTFSELPDQVKKLIVTRCMEKAAGPFMLIPQFSVLRGLEMKETRIPDTKSIKDKEDRVVFQVYDKSSSTALPGKGSGETIPHKQRAKYALLSKTKNWRRKLSTSWMQEFQLDGISWPSVDHYIEAQKFKTSAPAFYKEFSVESGSRLSQSSAMARAAGKDGRFGGKKVLPKGVLADPTLTNTSLDKALDLATTSKFKSNPDLLLILKQTIGADIMHYERAKPARRMLELEKLRNF